jgi:hypothetical protein
MKRTNFHLAFVVVLWLSSCNGLDNSSSLEGFEGSSSKGGIRNGKEVTFYEDGEIETISFWNNDSLHGQYLEFNEDGMLIRKGMFRNGKLFGSLVDFNEKGAISKIVQLYLKEPGTIQNQVIDFDDLGNVVLKNYSFFFVIKEESDTIRLGEEYIATIEVINPNYDSTLVKIGNYNEAFELKDSTNYSVFLSGKPKVIIRYKPTQKGEQEIRGWVVNLGVNDFEGRPIKEDYNTRFQKRIYVY